MNRIPLWTCLLAGLAAAAPKFDTLVAPDGSKAGLWVPKSRKKLPLVVWLHGGLGANNPAKGIAAASNMAATWGDSGAFALLAPSAWPASPWWSEDAARRIEDLVAKAAKVPGVDAGRIVLAGASDGGSGSLWLSVRLRRDLKNRVKGAAIWSADPDVMEMQGISWDPALLKGTALRWTAGTGDRLYPVERIRFWWDRCRAVGIRLESKETAGADHDLQFHKADLALFPAWVRKNAR